MHLYRFHFYQMRRFFVFCSLLSFAGPASLVCGTTTIPDLATTGLPSLGQVVVPTTSPIEKYAVWHMLRPRFSSATVASGSYLYVIGGANESDVALGSVERIDLATGHSEEFTKLRVARYGHRAVLVEDRIIVLGGRRAWGSKGLGLEGSIESIDLASGRIEVLGNMPEPLTRFGCVEYKNTVYITGGLRDRDRRSWINASWAYDLARNKWTSAAPMFTPRETEAVHVGGGFVIAIGGFNGGRSLANVEAWNLREGSWQRLPEMIKPRGASATVFIHPYILLFGDYEAVEEILAYDMRTKTSEVLRVGYSPARSAAVTATADFVYVVGGKDGPGPDSHSLDMVQVFKLAHDSRLRGKK